LNAAGSGEVLFQEPTGNGLYRGFEIEATPCEGDRPGIDVSGEDLDRRRKRFLAKRLGQQDGDGEGFFASGAARHPDPDVLAS
jgi:hypothetical protein